MGWVHASERLSLLHLGKASRGNAKVKTGIGKSDLPGLQGGPRKRDLVIYDKVRASRLYPDWITPRPAVASSSFKERIASYGITVFSIDFGEPVRLDEVTSRPVHSVRSSSARRITESIRRAEACSLPGEGVLAFEGKISRSCSCSKSGLRARSGLRKNSLPRIRANVQPMRSRTLWRSRSSGSFSSG